MLSYLKGTILNTNQDNLTLLVSGVGFLVSVKQTLVEMAKPQQELELYTYLAVSERALELFGFETQNELELFRTLLKVSKIGPKTALAILNKVSAQELLRAVQTNQPALLSKLGQKTAERVVSELKNKLLQGDFQAEGAVVSQDQEAMQALIGLGYSKDQAMQALVSTQEIDLDLQDKIKKALKYLGR